MERLEELPTNRRKPPNFCVAEMQSTEPSSTQPSSESRGSKSNAVYKALRVIELSWLQICWVLRRSVWKNSFILIDCVSWQTDWIIKEERCSFRTRQSCVKQVFFLKRETKKPRKMKRKVYMVFFNLKKSIWLCW